jgi:hypothetical protein
MAKSRRGRPIRKVPGWTPEGRELALLGVSHNNGRPEPRLPGQGVRSMHKHKTSQSSASRLTPY